MEYTLSEQYRRKRPKNTFGVQSLTAGSLDLTTSARKRVKDATIFIYRKTTLIDVATVIIKRGNG